MSEDMSSLTTLTWMSEDMSLRAQQITMFEVDSAARCTVSQGLCDPGEVPPQSQARPDDCRRPRTTRICTQRCARLASSGFLSGASLERTRASCHFWSLLLLLSRTLGGFAVSVVAAIAARGRGDGDRG
jgi:hypothetical protein